MPARTVRSNNLENGVHNTERVFHQRVSRGSYAVANQFQKSGVDHFFRGKVDAFARSPVVDCYNPTVGICERFEIIDVDWIDPNIVFGDSPNQRALRRNRPSLYVGLKEVRVLLDKYCHALVAVGPGEVRCADETRDGGGERRRGIPAIFLPTLLLGDWSLPDQKTGRGLHH